MKSSHSFDNESKIDCIQCVRWHICTRAHTHVRNQRQKKLRFRLEKDLFVPNERSDVWIGNAIEISQHWLLKNDESFPVVSFAADANSSTLTQYVLLLSDIVNCIQLEMIVWFWICSFALDFRHQFQPRWSHKSLLKTVGSANVLRCFARALSEAETSNIASFPAPRSYLERIQHADRLLTKCPFGFGQSNSLNHVEQTKNEEQIYFFVWHRAMHSQWINRSQINTKKMRWNFANCDFDFRNSCTIRFNTIDDWEFQFSVSICDECSSPANRHKLDRCKLKRA